MMVTSIYFPIGTILPTSMDASTLKSLGACDDAPIRLITDMIEAGSDPNQLEVVSGTIHSNLSMVSSSYLTIPHLI